MKTESPKISCITAASLLVLLWSFGAAKSQVPRNNDPPKAEGAIRIGLVTPRVSLIGGGGTGSQETTFLRQTLNGYLTGPRIGTVDLKAKLDSLAVEEGKERQCDYVLYSVLTRKRQTTSGSAGAYNSSTRAGDEVTFEYKLFGMDQSQPLAANVARARVESDGEDVLTPLIEAAAQVIVTTARSKLASVAAVPSQNADAVAPKATPVPTPAPRAPTGYGTLTGSHPRPPTGAVISDPPKAADAVRIGMLTPKMIVVGGSSMSTNEAASLRQTVSSYLAGSIIETIDLKARLDSLALTEGKKRECDYVLYTTLTRKRSSHSSSGGGIGGVVGGLGNTSITKKLPGGKTASDVSSGASSVNGTLAALTKANDEITFEYKLVAIDGARPIAAKLTKAKVKADGDDVLMKMIEAAAQTIVDATKKN